MFSMSIPVTDAFDESTPLEPISIYLPSEQIAWLRSQAEATEQSLDELLRAMIKTYRRDRPSPSASSSSEDSEERTPSEGSGPTSIVESLRSTSERLERLTERETTQDLPDPMERLRQRLQQTNEEASSEEGASSGDGDAATATSGAPPESVEASPGEGPTPDGSTSDNNASSRTAAIESTTASDDQQKSEPETSANDVLPSDVSIAAITLDAPSSEEEDAQQPAEARSMFDMMDD